jgi:N-acetylmuramoyl-L-alanine amidase
MDAYFRGFARAIFGAPGIAALAAIGLAPAAGAPQGGPPVAVAAHLQDSGDNAKLSFDLSAPVEAVGRPMTDPARIIVDIPQVNFQIDPSAGRAPAPRAGALVKAFRFGLFGPGKSRVVIELARPACIAKIETRPIVKGADPSRLIVELKPCDAEAFASAAKAALPPPAPVAVEPAAAQTSAGPPVIVIDPGHGGIDGGAFGVRGVIEKAVVYDYALELKKRLEANNAFKVILTRNGDEFVSLDDRVRIAQKANAALLVSVHADALAVRAGRVSGATVYTCSDRASDAESARIAERENSADKAAGVDQRADDAGVADILYDLKRRETRTYAHIFSRGLVADWQAATGRLNHNPERSAGFVVLKAADFPSVLVELGYLSSPEDVANMTSREWRAKTAAAMVASIQRFFAPPSKAGPAPAKPDEAIAASEKSAGAVGLRPGDAAPAPAP